MTKKEYIDKVLLIMNEAGMANPSGSAFIGADTTNINKQIEGSYLDAWRRCVKVMPKTWFENKSFKPPTYEHYSLLTKGVGYVELPNDFYLLTTFKMEGWEKSVQEAVLSSDIVTAIQTNDYTRGSIVRPVCVIDIDEVDGVIKRVLRYYSLPKGLAKHTVEKAIYVPIPSSLSDKDSAYDLKISLQVLEPLAYIAASTVFTMHEKTDIAKALDEKAVEMLGA